MSLEASPMKSAVIGHGYWGKNIARVLAQSQDFDLHTICDSDQRRLQPVGKLYPNVVTQQDFKSIDPSVELVAIITPTDLHYEMARYFLERGKNVLITKPFARTFKEAESLVQLADKNDVTVFVDHTFVFNPAVRKLKELLPRIGQPHFVMSQRLNLGLYQPDVNVIYDLMPHDISIISYLFDQPIVRAQTSAFKAAGLPQEDLAHSSFELKSGIKGLVTVSWLSPSKIRNFYVVGSDGMLSYDDTQPTEKIKFFDRGISLKDLQDPNSLASYTSRISYRNGDLYSPAISNSEALAFELSELKRAISDRDVRKSYNQLSLDIMKGLDLIVSST